MAQIEFVTWKATVQFNNLDLDQINQIKKEITHFGTYPIIWDNSIPGQLTTTINTHFPSTADTMIDALPPTWADKFVPITKMTTGVHVTMHCIESGEVRNYQVSC